MNKNLYFVLGALLASLLVFSMAKAAPTITYFQSIAPTTDNIYDNGGAVLRWAHGFFVNASTTDFTVGGRIYDGSASPGTNGFLLQTTGTGIKWTATSSLGLASTLTGTTGQVAYFSGTNAAVGTSTVNIHTNQNVSVGTTGNFGRLRVDGSQPGEPILRLSGTVSSGASGVDGALFENVPTVSLTSGNVFWGIYNLPKWSVDSNINISAFNLIANDMQFQGTGYLNGAVYGFESHIINLASGLGVTTATDIQMQDDQFSSPGVATLPVGNRFRIRIAGTTTGTSTTAGIAVGEMAGSGSNTDLLLGTVSVPAGNFGIYDSSAYQNYFKSNVGIGTTSPYAKLSVAGQTVAQYFTATTTGSSLADLTIPALATPAGTFVAADAAGKLIATTTPGGGAAITALTGDVTASGPGSSAATLATVNASVGSFTNANITVNAKGLITAASNGTAGSGTVTSVATNATLTGGPITTTGTLGLNLTNPNTWSALQQFSANASSTQFTTTGNTYLATTPGFVGIATTTAPYTTTTQNPVLNVGGSVQLGRAGSSGNGFDVVPTNGSSGLGYVRWVGASNSIFQMAVSSGGGILRLSADSGSATAIEFFGRGGLEVGRFDLATANFAVGTTSPLAKLDVAGTNNGTAPLFQLSSVASFATTTRFAVLNNGNVGIGIANPTRSSLEIMATTSDSGSHPFTVWNSGSANIFEIGGDGSTTASNGFNIMNGCYAVSGTCLTPGSGSTPSGSTQGVTWATAAVLSGTPTYSNGSSGVGATLTEVGTGALSVDGGSPAAADRVLVKNQASAFQNGIYTVTATGSGIASYILTRSSDYNTATLITPGITTYVISGTANTDTTWAVTYTAPLTIGTTNLNYSETAAGASLTSIGPVGQFLTGPAITIATTTTAFNGLTSNLTVTGSGSTLNYATAFSGTLGNAGLTNSTIGLASSDSSLTVSGSPASLGGSLGAVLNLAHANTWTALQTFGSASSTAFSSSYASSTSAFFGSLTLGTTTAGTLKTNSSGFVYVDTAGASIPNTLPNGLTATTTFYAGGLVFSDGSKLTQAANLAANALTWDATNFRLGIGSTTPTAPLSIKAASTTAAFAPVVNIAYLNNTTQSIALVIDQWGHLGSNGSTPTGDGTVTGNDRNGVMVATTGTGGTGNFFFSHPYPTGSTVVCMTTLVTNSNSTVKVTSTSLTGFTFVPSTNTPTFNYHCEYFF